MGFRRRRRRLPAGAGVIVAVVAAAAGGFASPALARSPATATGPVSARPASGTPQLAATGSTEQIRQLKQCGATMYAVGSFSSAGQGSSSYPRSNVFSFSATAPYRVSGWNPDVNGVVNTIAFGGSNCSNAYLGGNFTSVHGTAVKNIAEVSTSTGAVNPAFAHTANGVVETMTVTGSHLLTGGFFTSINNTPRHYYASLNLTTGNDDGYLYLNINGSYQYSGVAPNSTNIYDQQLSHGGRRLLVQGDFTSAGGQPRQQIFMLYLGSPRATVTGWASAEFNQHCTTIHPFYVKAAAWSPADSTVYIADTGDRPYLASTPGGLCDAVAAFSASEQPVRHQWVNYTGCDSLSSVAADSSAVYAAGHQRWANNPRGCNAAGPGAIAAPGMGGFTPGSGSLLLNAAGTAGLYSRGRGLGADDMLLTSAGLWIASDNFGGTGTGRCGGIGGHTGICFLPYP